MLLDDAVRQGRSLEYAGHRPWPLPGRGFLVGQTWEDVLFAHWRVPADAMRALVPERLEVDTHDGAAWLGVVSCRVTGVRLRGTLPVPGFSSFLSLHVRTYVSEDDKPGVWFLGLDLSSRIAADVTRRLFRLPCFHSRMSVTRRGDWTGVDCARSGEAGRVFSAAYRPRGGVAYARPDSLEWFLAERYCVYAADRAGGLHRADVHHGLWPLEPAEAEIGLSSVAPAALQGEPFCHVAGRNDVLLWSLEPIR